MAKIPCGNLIVARIRILRIERVILILRIIEEGRLLVFTKSFRAFHSHFANASGEDSRFENRGGSDSHFENRAQRG